MFDVIACVLVKELKLKDEECERLSKVRDQLGQELEELTASLFQVCLHTHTQASHIKHLCFVQCCIKMNRSDDF